MAAISYSTWWPALLRTTRQQSISPSPADPLHNHTVLINRVGLASLVLLYRIAPAFEPATSAGAKFYAKLFALPRDSRVVGGVGVHVGVRLYTCRKRFFECG